MFSKIIYFLSFVFFGYIAYTNYEILLKVPENLLKANLFLLSLVVLTQVLKYLVLSYNFYINFQKAGVSFKFKEVLRATFVYMYVSVSTPVVGAGGLLAFVDYAGHREYNRVKTAAGAFLALLADYLGFFIIAIFSFILFSQNIYGDFIAPVYSILGFGSLLILVVLLSIFTKDFLVKFFRYIQRFLNFLSHKIHKKVHLDDEWARRNVQLAHECFVDIKHDPKFYLKPIILSIIFHTLNIISFSLVAWSFKEVIPFEKIVSSYVIVNTLETVTPPNGIGFIEVLVPEFMHSIGIEKEIAIIIVTLFRFIYFYIPLLLGFYFSHRLFLGHKKKKSTN